MDEHPTERGGYRPTRDRWIRVDDRPGTMPERTAPRMRFDVLQLVGWAVGAWLLVIGIVAVARTGLTDLDFGSPIVEVVGLTTTPLLAGLLIVVGLMVLLLSTGAVEDRSLRMLGATIAIIGAVWFIEPDAFASLLATGRDHGTLTFLTGVLLSAASFVPPLSIRRPGT